MWLQLSIRQCRQASLHINNKITRRLCTIQQNRQEKKGKPQRLLHVYERIDSDPPYASSEPEKKSESVSSPSSDHAFKIKVQPVNQPSETKNSDVVKEILTEPEIKLAMEAAEKARKAETMWDTFVPDRKLGVKNPAFWTLLFAIILLRLYNNHQDELREGTFSEEEQKDLRLRQEALEKRRSREVTSTNVPFESD